ncbi:hypothetical protein BMG00_11070 [Thioclava marina]|uniref:Replication initiation protein n=2 Tax=Thioclava marina TaxID=1915077 RepID=A0ABX3MK70_9RHOB|nr:hypothetical protein BMG00_11070 [Thioclava marina]
MPPKRHTAVISSVRSPVLRPWKKLSSEERRREIFRFAQFNRGLAITLNLAPDFEALLKRKQQPMREVSKRFNAQLNSKDLRQLPATFVLEATRDTDRLHLHGIYIDGSIPRKSVAEAMRRAVGYVGGRRGARQFKSKLVYEGNGWKGYLSKDLAFTARLLALMSENQLWWTSRAMTQLVRADYESRRLGQHPANLSTAPVNAVS